MKTIPCWQKKEKLSGLTLFRNFIFLSPHQLKQKVQIHSTRTSFWSCFWATRLVFWVSPGERALWMPPLWFSLMEKSRDVRGLGANSFLGLVEASFILRSGKHRIPQCTNDSYCTRYFKGGVYISWVLLGTSTDIWIECPQNKQNPPFVFSLLLHPAPRAPPSKHVPDQGNS